MTWRWPEPGVKGTGPAPGGSASAWGSRKTAGKGGVSSSREPCPRSSSCFPLRPSLLCRRRCWLQGRSNLQDVASRSAQTRDSEVTLFTLSTVAFGVSYAGHLHCFSILMK